MALLPQELRGSKEETGTHLPSYHVAPLVAHNGQVSPGGYPIFIGIPDDSFRGRAYDEFLFQFCRGVHYHTVAVRAVHKPVVSYNCALLCKAGHVLCLAAEERLWNKEGEIGVLCARSLELIIQNPLHLFPYSIAVRLDYHTSSYCRLFCKICLEYKVVIPLRVVFCAFCQLICHFRVIF